MAIISRFLDPIELEIAGCPIAHRAIPSADTRACSSCPYNVVFPREARIGCSTRTPIEVFDAAQARLSARDPALADRLGKLLGAQALETGDAKAHEWLALAETWYANAETEDEREVASVAARFARTAIDRGVRVSILG